MEMEVDLRSSEPRALIKMHQCQAVLAAQQIHIYLPDVGHHYGSKCIASDKIAEASQNAPQGHAKRKSLLFYQSIQTLGSPKMSKQLQLVPDFRTTANNNSTSHDTRENSPVQLKTKNNASQQIRST
jgi:hypothetical protein